ncbi:MAG: M20/M25/M40 family metallo-hydrolase [Clostridia bacterium]|nr:M20/M25/M40 family metallo-hydrolase [Clostridia bacterium]
MKTDEILEKLCRTDGVSGFEEKIASLCTELLKDAGADEVYTDALGSVHAVFEPRGEAVRTVLLDAHMDEVGLMVSGVCENGMIKFVNIGGVDARVLPAMRVKIHGKRDYFGVITNLPPHITSSGDYKKAVPIDEMFIDAGLSYEEASENISAGDAVSFFTPAGTMLGGRFLSKALDDRAGITALLYAAGELKGKLMNTRIHVLFSTQEEFSLSGAAAGAYLSGADMCICVDVGHASTPDSRSDDTFELSGGPMIGAAPSLKKRFTREIIDLARSLDMTYQVEVMGGSSGTNAWSIAISGRGIPCALISIPLRYMHTGAEVVSVSDIEDAGRLAAEYVLQKDRG